MPVFDARERAQLEDVLTSQSWGGHPSPNRKATEFAAAFAAYQGARFAIPTTQAPARSRSPLKHSASAPATRLSSQRSLSPRLRTPRSRAWRDRSSPTSAPSTRASIESVRRLITRRTKAIIPVHYGASLADLDALAEISRAHSIPIVEDCAHVPVLNSATAAWARTALSDASVSSPQADDRRAKVE